MRSGDRRRHGGDGARPRCAGADLLARPRQLRALGGRCRRGRAAADARRVARACGCWPRASCRWASTARRCIPSTPLAVRPTRWRCSPARGPPATPDVRLDADGGQPASSRSAVRSTGCPLAIELAAARTKTLSVQEIARRLDDRFALLRDPASRGRPGSDPARRRSRWSYDLLFPDDQRGLWALACFVGGAPLAGARAGARGAGRARRGRRSTWSAGWSTARWLTSRSPRRAPCATACSTACGRSASSELARRPAWARSALQAHAPGSRSGRPRPRGRARRRTRLRTCSSSESSGPTSTPRCAGRATHDPLPSLLLANDLGWAWAVLGVGPDAAQSGPRRGRCSRHGCGSGASGDWSAAHRLARSVRRRPRPGDGGPRRRHADRRRGSCAARGSSTSRSSAASRGAPRTRWTAARCLGPSSTARGLQWEQGASWLLGAWAEIALGDERREGSVRRGAAPARARSATSGPWPRGGHAGRPRPGRAPLRRRRRAPGRAADAAHRLGFAAAEAHHLANLGRAQEQLGDRPAAAATLQRAIDTGEAAGDWRTAALARVRLGRVLRSTGDAQAARQAVQAGTRAGTRPPAAAMPKSSPSTSWRRLKRTPASRPARPLWRRPSPRRGRLTTSTSRCLPLSGSRGGTRKPGGRPPRGACSTRHTR